LKTKRFFLLRTLALPRFLSLYIASYSFRLSFQLTRIFHRRTASLSRSLRRAGSIFTLFAIFTGAARGADDSLLQKLENTVHRWEALQNFYPGEFINLNSLFRLTRDCGQVTTQYAKGVPTEVRGNTDCAIIFKQFQFMQRESICNDYLDLLPEKYLRYALLDAHTGGENEEDRHKGLAVVTSKLSSRMSETLRTVHAEEVPDDFLMGDPEFWFAAANGDLMRLRNTFVEGASVKKAKPKLREEKKAKSKAKK
jgi:hypothetical protein